MDPKLPNNSNPQDTHSLPTQMTDGDGNDKKTHHVPRSTLIIFWIFVVYFVLTIIGAVYFMTITKVKIFELNNLASLSSNLSPKKSIDLPMCIARTNKTALRSSLLQNEYNGRVKSFETDISSQSADFHSTITLERGFGNLFTYFINKNEIKRVIFYNGAAVKNRSIEGLEVGDSIVIRETLNLLRPPHQSKTKIEIETL